VFQLLDYREFRMFTMACIDEQQETEADRRRHSISTSTRSTSNGVRNPQGRGQGYVGRLHPKEPGLVNGATARNAATSTSVRHATPVGIVAKTTAVAATKTTTRAVGPFIKRALFGKNKQRVAPAVADNENELPRATSGSCGVELRDIKS
jgi:hypothetical protein